MGSESAADVRWVDRGRVTGGSGDPPPTQGTQKSAGAGNSRKRLLWALGFLACAAVLLNIKLVFDLSDAAQRTAVFGEVRPKSDSNDDPARTQKAAASETLDTLRNRLLVLLGLTMLCFGSCAYVLFRKFLGPLTVIGEGAREIAGGNLAVTVPGSGEDELGKLGAAVNDIAVNYQEILLLAGTQAGKCLAALERMEKTLQEGSVSAEELSQDTGALKNELSLLRDVVQEFRFYDAHFDGGKVVRNDPK